MLPTFFRIVPNFLFASGLKLSLRADCKTATVGSPFSTCFDIYTNAGISADQFNQFNPGLNCAAIQPGQKVCISAGTLPSNAPSPNPDGSCARYTTVDQDSCFKISTKFTITTDNIELWNSKTYKWKGCAGLQGNFTMCVSSGTPPPIPVNPLAQCGPTSSNKSECPLKACCSGSGFCGTTDEYCSANSSAGPCDSNCFQPTLPSCSGSATRKITYYAGWGSRRSCNAVSPSDIDLKGFTHVNFAFATISQGLQIQIDGQDDALLKTLVGRKKDVPNLKVLIAVGGWAFSQDTPTRDLFSVMVSTAANRATFLNSVKAFLSKYSLDGIDIDFEYPSAIERSGPPEDTPNLTTFMREMRSTLSSSILSIAAPAGYWFLKGFKIDEIASSLDHINMMSYDYHGPWDTNITDQDPVSNPQSSIKDMQDSALLYVRAGIDLKKVNLGLAWYGRSFGLVNPSCKGYGCTMRGGGVKGKCTGESGVLSQFEIEDLLKGQSSTLDSDSQTHWFNLGNDLITFDQDDTWGKKTDFANNHCFGGTFIWSQDQRLPSKTTDPNPSPGPDGQCGFHVTQFQKPDPSRDPYTFTLVVKGPYGEELGRVDKAVGKPGAPIKVTSKLPDAIEISAGNVDKDPIAFSYRGETWDTNDKRCSIGGYESGNREGDCGFTCRLPPVPVCGNVLSQAVLSSDAIFKL